jgi:hypothetical protein
MLILIFLLALLLIPLWTYFLLCRYILCYVHGVYTSSQDLLSTVLHGVSSRFSITFLLAVPIPRSFVFRANASHVLVMVMAASNWTWGLIPVEKAVHMIWAFLLLDFLLVTLHIILLLDLLLSPPILRFVIIVLLVLLWQLVTIPRVNLVIIILIWSKVLLLSPNIWSTFLAKNIYECILFFSLSSNNNSTLTSTDPISDEGSPDFVSSSDYFYFWDSSDIFLDSICSPSNLNS